MLKIACVICLITVVFDMVISTTATIKLRTLGPYMLIATLPQIWSYMACWRFLVNKNSY